MSESFVIELNQNSATWSRPGEYECTLSQPIAINEGDQLAFRMASLDSNITDTDTILLTNDQVLTAQFSYYEVNYDGTDKQSVGVGGGVSVSPDYKYYTAYNDVQLVTVTGIDLEIIGFVPIGEGPEALTSSYIIGTNGIGSAVDPNVNFTATFTYIDASGSLQYARFTGSNAKYDPSSPIGPIYYTDSQDGTLTLQVTPFTMRTGTLQFSGVAGYWPGADNNDVAKQTTFGAGSFVPRINLPAPYDNDFPYETADFKIGTVTYALTGGTTNNVLDIQTVSVTLRAGRYDPQSLAVQLTQLFSSAGGIKPGTPGGDQIYVSNNPFLIRTDDPRNANLIFNKVPPNRVTNPIVFQNGSTYKYYNPADPLVIPPYFVGATEFSIEYDVGGGAVFQVSYCHMPMSDPGRPGEQDVALYTSGSPGAGLQYHAVTSASGIAFHDLQPASFWQDKLGLRDKLIVPLMIDSNGLQYYTETALLRSITYGFQGLSSFLLPPTGTGSPVTYPDFRKMSPLVPSPNPLYLNVTGQSRAIVGDTRTVNTVGGYFLIEVLNVFRSTGGYVDTQENRRYISAIVSTEMDNNNCITGYSDGDTVGYVHRGASYLVSSATVRILNPITKQPVTTLGPNNCIWLQIQKIIQQQQQSVSHATNVKTTGEIEERASAMAKVKPKPKIIRREKPVLSPEQEAPVQHAQHESAPEPEPAPAQAKEEVKEEPAPAPAKPKPKIIVKVRPKEEAKAEPAEEKPKYKGPLTSAGYPDIMAMREKMGMPPIGKMRPEPGAVAESRAKAWERLVPETVTERRADVPPELK